MAIFHQTFLATELIKLKCNLKLRSFQKVLFGPENGTSQVSFEQAWNGSRISRNLARNPWLFREETLARQELILVKLFVYSDK